MARAPNCRDCKYYYENCDVPWPVCELNEFHFEDDYTICEHFEPKYGSLKASKSSSASGLSGAPKAARFSSPLGGVLLLGAVVLVVVIVFMGFFRANVEDVPGANSPSPGEDTQPDDPPASGYLLPTDTEYISDADLSGFSKDEVTLVRNEIYARHGYNFKNDTIRTYFEAQDWYSPVPGVDSSNFDAAVLNQYEQKNLATIIAYERSMGWRS